MLHFLLFFAAAATEPVEAAVVSRAIILFLMILIGLGVLLVGLVLLNRSRKLRRAELSDQPTSESAAVDPWLESAKRLERPNIEDGT